MFWFCQDIIAICFWGWLGSLSLGYRKHGTVLTSFQSLLSPLGHHRRSYISTSKGKRAKNGKRKRKQPDVDPSASGSTPPTPETAKCVDLGLARISRSLEQAPDHHQPYAAVFVARSGQPSAFHSHFPQMVAVASSSKEPIRLIGFSKSCEDRLSSCLGIPRVSSIGLRDGVPQTKALLDFLRQHVPAVDMPWLQEARSGKYLDTKINALEVPIGVKKQRRS